MAIAKCYFVLRSYTLFYFTILRFSYFVFNLLIVLWFLPIVALKWPTPCAVKKLLNISCLVTSITEVNRVAVTHYLSA